MALSMYCNTFLAVERPPLLPGGFNELGRHIFEIVFQSSRHLDCAAFPKLRFCVSTTSTISSGLSLMAEAAETVPRLSPRLAKIDFVFFGLSLAAVLTKSIVDLDLTWDSLNYHLPFAARRAGLIPAGAYEFTQWLEDCYKGIPAVPYYIYGALWRASRNINTPNIVAGLAFAGYCVFVARTFRTPLTLVAVSVAAIPVIQVALSSVYTDLVTNVCFAGGLMLATSVLIERQRPLLWRVIGALAFVSVPANFKLQFVAIGGMFPVVFGIMLFAVRENGQRLVAMLLAELRDAVLPTKALFLIVTLLCYASAIKNTLFYGNPVFPIGISVMGVPILPGLMAGNVYHEPRYLDGKPEVLQWTLSVLEYLSLGSRPVPYKIGQGDVASDSQALRMGGYCAFYVIYNLGLFAWMTLFSSWPRKALAAAFLALTLVVACLPGAHELRYYSFWMIYLVTMNIALLWRWHPDRAGRRHFIMAAVATFVFVASVTGWRVFIPAHETARTVMAGLKLDLIFEPRLKDGETYCLGDWGPYPLFAASFFHHGHAYAIRETGPLNCLPGQVRLDLEKLRVGG